MHYAQHQHPQKGAHKMGYTHYFTQPADFTDSQWTAVQTDVQAITDTYLGYAYELNIDRDAISVDGGCETLVIYREIPVHNQGGWDFCKTNHHPYDAIVTAILLRLVYAYNYTVSSDGSWLDWQEGRDLYKATFNAEPTDVLNRQPQEVI
jgi:hypothetical protein